MGKQKLGSKSYIREFAAIADNRLPADHSWYMLPRDFTAEEWEQLTSEEKLGSMHENCRRLERVVEDLNRKLLEARMLAAAGGFSIILLLSMMMLY